MKALKVISTILLLSFLLQGCYAFKWKPANLTDKQLQELIEHDKPDEVRISFWDLPLWVKMQYILTVLAGILGALKFLPLILTKVKSVLDNSKRSKILRVISRNPGISIAELENITGINRSTLRFHLSVLEKEGLIWSLKAGKYRIFFPAGKYSHCIKSERKMKIIELLSQNESLTVKDIAEILGVSYYTAYRHVRELERAGFVCVNGKAVELPVRLLFNGTQT